MAFDLYLKLEFSEKTKAQTTHKANTQVETSLSKAQELQHPEAKHCWDLLLLLWGR